MGIEDRLVALSAEIEILETAGPLDFDVWMDRHAADVRTIRDRLQKSAAALKTAYTQLRLLKIFSPEYFEAALAFGLNMDAIVRAFAIASTIAESTESPGIGARKNDQLKNRTIKECSRIWEKFTGRPLPKTTDGRGSQFCRLFYEIAAGREAPANSFQKPILRER